ncbi:hypothetical protein LPH50_05770 [Xylella taiwanensis]|nr:hypothetical protein [Xylella taiwanensis]AXI82489.1 hypothetical protein AB672_00085 [Xylella taiwanensis]MCD8463917.1 hypothetical protein [Xylella taiwanensis]MCD8464528.1 hypothetical protein [Xylella taiwanensis]MCD8467914.1 hypothetical protein [Xylella taiwanensis]UFN07785.1 hypothetical protein LPH42_05630 [Xylella taiwanensis]
MHVSREDATMTLAIAMYFENTLHCIWDTRKKRHTMPFANIPMAVRLIYAISAPRADKILMPPLYGDCVLTLEHNAKNTLKTRITDILRKSSRSIEIMIDATGSDSTKPKR